MKLQDLLADIAKLCPNEDKLLDLDVKIATKIDRTDRVKAIQNVKLQNEGSKFSILIVTTPEPSSGK